MSSLVIENRSWLAPVRRFAHIPAAVNASRARGNMWKTPRAEIPSIEHRGTVDCTVYGAQRNGLGIRPIKMKHIRKVVKHDWRRAGVTPNKQYYKEDLLKQTIAHLFI